MDKIFALIGCTDYEGCETLIISESKEKLETAKAEIEDFILRRAELKVGFDDDWLDVSSDKKVMEKRLAEFRRYQDLLEEIDTHKPYGLECLEANDEFEIKEILKI